jgi:lipopolysaccharide transport system ATP-binding protein
LVVAVEVENVSKRFRRQTVQPSTTLKTALVDFILQRRRRDSDSTFQALRGISFTVQPGRTLGIIGRNGSGKSTLLKLLAGIYRPDGGRIAVHGKVGALLELGAGFHPEFTGRENVLINGIVLGLSKREIRKRFDAIVRFAELEAFIDEPVKTYSSGMYMRLGFSVAIHADPEILLIDEILGVGDESFQQKCLDKMAELRSQQKTIIAVSHELAAVERWSDEALWLENGTVREHGSPQKVIEHYRQGVAIREAQGTDATQLQTAARAREAAPIVATLGRSRDLEVVSAMMLDSTGTERYVYRSGESAALWLHYQVHRVVGEPIFGFVIYRDDGVQCYGSDTDVDGAALPALGQAGIVEVLLERLDLLDGTYFLDVSVRAADGHPYDRHHRLCSFTIISDREGVGVFRVPHRWSTKQLSSSSHQRVISDASGRSTRTSTADLRQR